MPNHEQDEAQLIELISCLLETAARTGGKSLWDKANKDDFPLDWTFDDLTVSEKMKVMKYLIRENGSNVNLRTELSERILTHVREVYEMTQ